MSNAKDSGFGEHERRRRSGLSHDVRVETESNRLFFKALSDTGQNFQCLSVTLTLGKALPPRKLLSQPTVSVLCDRPAKEPYGDHGFEFPHR